MMEATTDRIATENVATPTDYTISRTALLDTYWDTPISFFTDTPGVLLQPNLDTAVSLGAVLSENGFNSYADFRKALVSTDTSEKAKARVVAGNLHKIFPYPKELLEQNPDLFNWVPWEAVIAYGKKLDATLDKAQAQPAIDLVVKGDVFTKPLRNSYESKGYIPERTNITLERQNANALLQGPQEAIANAIDAISERDQIGQFAMGVKQMFNLLQSKDARLKVTTKEAGGEVLIQEAKKGFRDQVYLKFSPPTEEDSQRFQQTEHGTLLEATGLELTKETQQELLKRITDRFKFVPDANIYVNGVLINNQEDVTVVGRRDAITPAGEINIQISENHISIQDNGRGMNKRNLFRMFLPGLGSKQYKILPDSEVSEHIQKQGEVILKKEDKPQIVFTRNRESIFAIDIPETRLNDSQHTICLELGRALQVSEGREGFEIDNTFVLGINSLVEKMFENEAVEVAQKIEIVNSLIMALDTLNGDNTADNENETNHLIHTIKKSIQEKAQPIITDLIKSGKKVLPNYKQYSKVMNADHFVDPYILSGHNRLSTLLIEQGYQRLTQTEGVVTKNQWTVLTGPITHGMSSSDLSTDMKTVDGLQNMRRHHERILPLVIDTQSRIAIIDQQLWEEMLHCTDEVQKAILQESLQSMINHHVITSYEINDPRSIFVTEATSEDRNTNRKIAGESLFDEQELKILEHQTAYPVWVQGNHIYCIKDNQTMMVIDKHTKELVNITTSPFSKMDITGSVIQPQKNGTWFKIGKETYHLDTNFMIDQRYSLHPDYNAYQGGTFLPDGNFIYTKELEGAFGEIDSVAFCSDRSEHEILQTQVIDNYSSLPSVPYQLPDGKIAIAYEGRIEIEDMDIVTQFSSEGCIQNSSSKFYGQRFFMNDGQLYFLAIKDSEPLAPVGEDDDNYFAEDTYTEPFVTLYKVNYKDNQTITVQEVFSRNEYNLSQFYCSVNEDTGEFVVTKDFVSTVYKITPDGVAMETEITLQETDEDIIEGVGSIYKALQNVTTIDLESDTKTLKKTQAILSLLPEEIRRKRIQQFETIMNDPAFIAKYNSVLDLMYQNSDPQQASFMEDHVTGNLFLLSEFSPEEVTEEKLWILALVRDPYPLLKMDGEMYTKFEALIKGMDRYEEKLAVIDLINTFSIFLPKEQTQAALNQLDKILSNNVYKKEYVAFYEKEIKEQSVHEQIQHPENLNELSPLRAWTLFLTGNAEFLRNNETAHTTENYQQVIPSQTPIELIAYLRKLEGLQTIEEMNDRIQKAGGVEQLMASIDLTYYRDELRKAIHGQAVGAGVEKRELLQNALYACRKNYSEDSQIVIDFYYRNNGKEYVEEIKDNGTGIQNLPVFWVPGLSDKDEGEGLGFFGSGFNKIYKQLNKEGDSLEVDTVVKTSTGLKKTVMRYAPVIQQENVVGMVLSEVKCVDLTEGSTGTSIRLVKNAEGRLPELEAMIAKNTYIAMGGLAAHPNYTDKPVKILFVNHENQQIEPQVTVEKLSSYMIDIDDHTVTFVKTPQLKTFMSSGGLHMSYLENTNPDYLDSIPVALKNFIMNEHISSVIDPRIALIKDRSRIANEQEYVPYILSAYTSEAIKQIAFKILSDSTFHLPEVIPEDVYSNPNYANVYVSENGREARRIAGKIMRGALLDTHDLMWISENDSSSHLFLVIANIEKAQTNSQFDSIIRRFQKVQSSSGNSRASNGISREYNIDETTTEISTTAHTIIEHSIQQSSDMQNSHEYITEIEDSLSQGKLPDGIQHITDIQQPDKEYILKFFRAIGFTDLYIAPADKLHAQGLFSMGTKRMFLSSSLFTGSSTAEIRKRWETIIHENAHLFEAVALGFQEGSLDRHDQKDPQLTHQQNGPFGHYYRLGAYGVANFINMN